MSGYGPTQIERDRIRIVRGVILLSLRQHQPLLRSMVLQLVRGQELGLADEDVAREIEYLEKRGWVSIARDAAHVIGRKDWSLRLTAIGEDVARGVDPNAPVLFEGGA